MAPAAGSNASPPPRGALGALRESLSALSNLEGLLRSIKVSPKSVAGVLPDVLDGCEPLLGSLSTLGQQFPTFVQDPCLAQLEAELRKSSATLQDALSDATRRPLNASARLRTEAAVSLAVREMGASLPLLELLADVDQAAGTLDWVEALSLSRRGDQSRSPGSVSADVVLLSDEETAPVAGLLPRAALNLVRLTASLVYRKDQPLTLHFGRSSSQHVLVVDRSAAEGPHIKLLLPGVITSTLPCLRAAASALSLELANVGEQTSLSWPRSTD